MKQFLAFVHKEFLHILRDKRTILILIGMPIAQILIFGFAISTEVRNIRLMVVDNSHTQASREITQRVAENSYFQMEGYAPSYDDVERAFREGRIDMAMVFDDNFQSDILKGDAQIQLLADGSDPNSAQASSSYATAIIQSYAASLVAPNTPTRAVNRPVMINPDLKLLYNPQMIAAYNFVPGVMGLILMLICAMMTALAIVQEKERGSMEVLLASPIRPIFIILSKVAPYFVLSVINVVTILLLAVFVFDVPIVGSLWTLALFCLLFTFTALALGMLISSIVATQISAMMLSGVGLMMPTTILSGMMFPLESMPIGLQYFSNIIPARWFIEGVRRIMIQGVEIQYVITELLVLAVMATVLIILSLKKFKKRLE